MNEDYTKREFDALKTPDERRKWVEALHEKAHGKSHFDEQAQAIHNALDGRYDKDSVLKVMAELLGVEPVEKDGVYWLGDWEVRFGKDNNLRVMSASSGGAGMIQIGTKFSDDT